MEGERPSIICINSRFPSLTLPPELRKKSSGSPLILHYGELSNYFVIHPNVIIIEIKCPINVKGLNHPENIPLPQSMVKLSFTRMIPDAKRLRAAV